MKEISVVATCESGPQDNAEAMFKLGNGVEVWPGLALQNGLDSAVVNTCELLSCTETAASHRITDVECEPACDFSAGVYRRHVGPGVGALPREASRRSGHELSVDDLMGVVA